MYRYGKVFPGMGIGRKSFKDALCGKRAGSVAQNWSKSRAFRRQVGKMCNISLVEVSVVDASVVGIIEIKSSFSYLV